MGDGLSKATESSGTESYHTDTITVSFYIPLPKASYKPPETLAVRHEDGSLDLENTQAKIEKFVGDFDKLITTSSEAQSVGKSFLKALGLTPANWKDFGVQFPALIYPVKKTAFRIATLILKSPSQELVAAQFLSRIVTSQGYGINQEGHLISASRLPECSYVPKDPSISKGEALYDKLILSLKYSLTAHESEFDDDSMGHGGCFSVEKNSAQIRANAGKDRDVNEQVENELDAKDSYSSSSPIQSYHWEQISGPNVKWATSQDDKQTRFVTPQVFQNKILQFRLTITDQNSTAYTDMVTYQLLNNINEEPKIALTGDKEVMAREIVRLTATASDDNPDDTLTYTWEEKTKYGIRIHRKESTDPKKSQIYFTAPTVKDEPYDIKIRVTVNDGHISVQSQEWIIKVLPNPNPEPVAVVTPPPPPKPASTAQKTNPVPSKSKSPIKPVAQTAPVKVLPPPQPDEVLVDEEQDLPVPPIPFPTKVASVADSITNNLPPTNPKKPNNRLLILMDPSGSMSPVANSFSDNIDLIVEKILEKTLDGGFVEVALGYYDNGRTEIIMPFQKAEKLLPDQVALLKDQLKINAQAVSAIVRTSHYGTETLWHAIFAAIAGTEKLDWKSEAEFTNQMIYALTDGEALNDPRNIIDNWTEETATQLASNQGITVKTIEFATNGEDKIYEANNKLANAVEVLAKEDAPLESKIKAAVELETASRQELGPHLLALYDRYGNTDESVRMPILRALAKLKSKDAKKLFRKILMDKNNSLQIRALALSALRDVTNDAKELEAILLALANDKNNPIDLRQAAVKILCEFPSSPQIAQLASVVVNDSAPEFNIETKLAVATYVLKNNLKDSTETAENIFTKVLTDPESSSAIQSRALVDLMGLPGISETKINQLVLTILQNQDRKHDLNIRFLAARYLKENKYAEGHDVYLSVFRNHTEEASFRLEMVSLLQDLGTPKAIWALNQEMLDNNVPLDLRQACANALKELAKTSPQVKMTLAILNQDNPVLNKDEEEVKLSVLTGIVKDESGDLHLRSMAIDSIKATGGPQAIATLIAQMNDPNSSTNVRQNSAVALGSFNEPHVVVELVIVFSKKGADPYLRSAAGEALVKLGSPEAVASAIQILKEETTLEMAKQARNPEIVPAAIKIVASSRDPQAVQLIKKVMYKYRNNELIQETAKQVLAQMQG